jgi:hypothetical protein
MFVCAAALNVNTMVTGAERLSLMVGEAFIAAGWLGGLLGLLGLYSVLADQSRWSTRAGAVFAVSGAVAFVVLAAGSLVAYFNGGGVGDLPIPFVYLFPGVIAGSLLAFISFSVASLRSDLHSRTFGILLLVPALIFFTNFFILPFVVGDGTGPAPPEVIGTVTGGLALVMLAIGYVLRTEDAPPGGAKVAAETATK